MEHTSQRFRSTTWVYMQTYRTRGESHRQVISQVKNACLVYVSYGSQSEEHSIT